MTPSDQPALDRYRIHAERLGKRFNDLSPEQVLASVANYLPAPPARILDIGAGTGRDAAWLARQGHEVTAVEPVDELARQAADFPGADRIAWIDDQLPVLAKLQDRPASFDFCLMSGVWHHMAPADRPTALTTIARLLAPGGRLAMSIRIGGDDDGITLFAIDPDETLTQAATAGLTLLHRAPRPSVQPANIAAGVTWDWLVLQRGGANPAP